VHYEGLGGAGDGVVVLEQRQVSSSLKRKAFIKSLKTKNGIKMFL